MRDKKENVSVYVPMSFEYLMSSLFGQQFYHGYVGYLRLKRWKKDLIKILKTVRKTIEINIDTDEFHKNELCSKCDLGIRKLKESKYKDQLDVNMVESLTRIVFMLIGDMPENSRKKSTANPKCWKLDQARKITYVQTLHQRVWLIMHRARIRGEKNPDYDELWEKHFEYRGDKRRFIEWYKEAYPDKYLRYS